MPSARPVFWTVELQASRVTYWTCLSQSPQPELFAEVSETFTEQG